MKRKILVGVGLFLVLLFATGIGAIYLLKQTSREQSRTNEDIFERSQALQSLRYDTSSINTYYLPDMLMGDDELKPINPPELFQEGRERMEASLANARKGSYEGSEAQLGRLDSALNDYFLRYETLFDELPTDKEERIVTVNDIADGSQTISDLSQGLVAALASDFRASNASICLRSEQGSFIIGMLLVLGTVLALVFYILAGRLIVDPILDLTDSVREIQKGNFELVLPLRRSKDELSTLIPAFNEMIAELQARRKDSDDRLLKVDLLNRAILASFPHPILLLDDRGHVVKLNPEAEGIFEESSGLGSLPSRIQDKIEESIEQNAEYLPETLDEAVLIRREDAEFFYLPRLFRLSYPDGKDEGWVLLLTDVSRLRFFDDLKSNLISTVSHEIKTPLTGIRMVLLLLLEAKTGNLNDTQQEMLNSAHADCERLLETLRNLLEMSRSDSGANSLNLEELAPSQVFEDALNTFQGLASEKEIQLVHDYEDRLPDILADKLRISEVVNNLLSNALKHSPPKHQVTLAIARQGADFVRFSVRDQGSGVPEAARPRIFDRFYRAEGQAGIDGIGLGLSIAREVVTAHEGQIGLTQGPSDETEFYFDLPRV